MFMFFEVSASGAHPSFPKCSKAKQFVDVSSLNFPAMGDFDDFFAGDESSLKRNTLIFMFCFKKNNSHITLHPVCFAFP